MAQAVRHDAMRARNLAFVLREVRSHGSLTRACLAEVTGLTKTTVSKLVADLLEAGLVVETGAVQGRGARPSGVEVRVSGDRVAAVGLEINVDYLAVRVVDLTRRVRLRLTQAVDNRLSKPMDVIGDLRRLARSALAQAEGTGLHVVGAGPGRARTRSTSSRARSTTPPTSAGGTCPWAPPSTSECPCGWRTRRTWPPSASCGSAPARADFLYVSGEIGIGAGLVVNGALFRGSRGFAGELGHVVVTPEGPECRCGARGCLEQYAGPGRLPRRGRRPQPLRPRHRRDRRPPGAGRPHHARRPARRRAGRSGWRCRRRSTWSTRTRSCSAGSTRRCSRGSAASSPRRSADAWPRCAPRPRRSRSPGWARRRRRSARPVRCLETVVADPAALSERLTDRRDLGPR